MNTIQAGEQLALYASIKKRLSTLHHDSVLGMAIEIAVRDKKWVGIIKSLKSAITDNYELAERILGVQLTKDIKEVEV